MTTTCEHGREAATCPDCGALSPTAEMVKAAVDFEEAAAKIEAVMQAEVDEAIVKEFGEMRPLTDVEEQWVRMKHPDLPEDEVKALIAEGLPADVAPITRADLPKPEPSMAHAFRRDEWDRRRQARKASAASKRRNRPTKAKRSKKAKAKR